MTNTIVADQQALEALTIDKGRKRFEERTLRKTAREGFDRHTEAAKLIRGAIPILSEGLTDWVEHAKKQKGRNPAGLKAVAALDPDVVAAIGMTAIFRSLGDGGRVSDITDDIGRRVEVELEAAALEAADPKAAERFLKLAEGDMSARLLEERFKALVSEHEAALQWSRNTKVLVGQAVLNVALVKLQELFVSKTIMQNGSRLAIVDLTDECAQALVEMEDIAAMQHLPLMPMVAKPRTWEHQTSGAYYDFRLSKLVPMVRTRSKEHRRLLKDAIADGSMQEVLDALNAIQDTRWAVDTRVLQWIMWCRENGKRTAKSFPTDELPDLPPKIEPEVWEGMTKEERSARSRKRKSLKELRKSIGIDGKTFSEDMETAHLLAGYEAFYMPHSLDFRGRTYAVPYFNHQRSDHLKALFRFADGLPLGDEGGEWLMIHLANCGDFGKVSKQPFGARVAWVEGNSEMILAAAADPAAHYDWWSQADSPFCFLQACFEYAEWAAIGFSTDYVSFISGAADGSCSGLQHYSAITRSEGEAYHVNLVPRPDVGDIYKVTADVAAPSIQALANRTDPLDRKEAEQIEAAKTIIANGFGRSEVKRNVMTYFYGSARFGMRDQHMQDLMRPLADQVATGELESHPYSLLTERTNKDTGEVTVVVDGGYTCAAIMAAHVYSAVTTVAAKADEAATWIQKVAATLAHESLSMVWRTQTGFPVVQRYSEYMSKEVNLWLYDRAIKVPEGTDKVDHEGNVLSRVRVLIRQAPTARVDKSTMRSASSPNVIHSMDAAHLHRSVAMAKREGIEHFCMIHDSFGTHLGNMAKFSAIIRAAFVACYENYCPLQELDRYARSVLSEEGIEKLPPLPARGNLDLRAVLEAPFAFA